MPPMRHALIASIAAGLCSSALATSSASFEAQGYLLDVVIGDDSRPLVAGLSMATPGSAQSVQLPMRHIRVESFDAEKQILLLRFENPGDSTLPKDFFLTVRNDTAVLQIDGKSIAGRFSWGM